MDSDYRAFGISPKLFLTAGNSFDFTVKPVLINGVPQTGKYQPKFAHVNCIGAGAVTVTQTYDQLGAVDVAASLTAGAQLAGIAKMTVGGGLHQILLF